MTHHYFVNSNIKSSRFTKMQQNELQHRNMSIPTTTTMNVPLYDPNVSNKMNTNKSPPIKPVAAVMEDKQKVHTETLLVGPSIINASPTKNNHISLPSMNELYHNNQNIDNRIVTTRDHPSNHNTRFVPSPPTSSSYFPSTPVQQQQQQQQRLSMMSNNSQKHFIITPETFVRRDSRTTTKTTVSSCRPLKRQKSISPLNAYILPKKKSKNEKQQCHSCQSTETPEWRKGPLGPRTLCNACGLIWTKLCKQQEEGDKSRRKFTKNKPSPTVVVSPSTTSNSPVTMEYCNNSGSCSSSSSSSGSNGYRSPSPTLKKNSNDSKRKLTLSFLLS